MNQQRHLFKDQSITKSHWTRAHNPSPQQGQLLTNHYKKHHQIIIMNSKHKEKREYVEMKNAQ